MTRFLELVRTRLVPAGLTAAGVALVMAGLLTYIDPASAGIPPAPSPTLTAEATPEPSAEPTAEPTPPGPSPSTVASPSTPPTTAPSPAASPTPAPPRMASRVAVPALRIDLPVIRPPNDGYPLCDVAMFLETPQGELGQPGEGRAVYLYAHARDGMFLPLLEQSRIRNGEAMKGMFVQVWTTDEWMYLYEITEVRRHQTTLDDALTADHEQLWLQTSEGPRGTVPKLQVVAELVSNGPAADPEDAHPTPRPVDCG